MAPNRNDRAAQKATEVLGDETTRALLTLRFQGLSTKEMLAALAPHLVSTTENDPTEEK